ncbi:MAG: putative glycoside hydrolase [Actinomycetota bacterium]
MTLSGYPVGAGHLRPSRSVMRRSVPTVCLAVVVIAACSTSGATSADTTADTTARALQEPAYSPDVEATAHILASGAQASAARRPWPDTTSGVHVFGDQPSEDLTDAQLRFVATHYAGVQKITRSEAGRYRAVNPGFLVLHYRLGLGLGYRAIEGACEPSGGWLRLIEGDEWVVEWPGNNEVEEGWFFHQPEGGTQRVLNCDWGWYLMDLDKPGWRAFWTGEVERQLEANDDDGVFIDSLSVPNYLGGGSYDPALPDVDPAFEAAWTERIDDWLAWLQSQPIGDAYLVPNAGSWITTRDATTYAAADGLMIEGFAIEADESPYPLEDWRLQMDRVLGAVGRGQAILAQSYALGDQERMFGLGSYLLVKGARTFLTFEWGFEPEWWPEYDVPIGAPIETAEEIADLDPDGDRVYVRRFDNGMVLVNPTSPWDGTGVTRTVDLGGTFQLVRTSGGGALPPSGVPGGTVTFETVTEATLPPYSAAVVLTGMPSELLCRGQVVTLAGTAGPDTLRGTGGRDVVSGLAGDDVLIGLEGRDVMCGGSGDDRLSGGSGGDVLIGGPGSDVLVGGPGTDTCRPGAGAGVERSCERIRP